MHNQFERKQQISDYIMKLLEYAWAGRFDIARDYLAKIKEHCKEEGDMKVVEALEKNIIAGELAEDDMGVPELMPAWKKSLSLFEEAKVLAHPMIDEARIESEIVRLNVQIDFTLQSRLRSDQVIGRILQLCKDYPDDPVNFYRLGYTLYGLRNYGEAKSAVLRSRGLMPDSSPTYYYLGMLFMFERDFWKAIHCYEMSLDKLKDSNSAINQIGIAYYNLGYYDKAITKFEEALEKLGEAEKKKARNAFFSNNLGFCLFRKYHRLGGEEEVMKNHQEIANLYCDAILKDKANATAHFNLAYLTNLAEKHNQTLETTRPEKSALRIFQNTKGYYDENMETMRSLACSFFIQLCKGGKAKSIQDQLLESLFQDVENFLMEAFELQELHSAFLSESKKATPHLSSDHLMILKKWATNFSPCVPEFRASGGGFFLRWKNFGIVIDPGLNFVTNFRECGYTIPDINAIILTCDDPRETIDLEPLLMLMNEINENGIDSASYSTFHQVTVYLNFPCILKFGQMFSKYKFVQLRLIDTQQVTQINKDIELSVFDLYGATKTGGIDSIPTNVGVLLNLFSDDHKNVIKAGYVGQTAFHETIREKVEDRDILILSVGSIKFRELLAGNFARSFSEELENLIQKSPRKDLRNLGFQSWEEFTEFKKQLTSTTERKRNMGMFFPKNNLGFIGVNKILENSNCEIAILTDLTQELGHLRNTVAEVLNNHFKEKGKKKKILTGEIGLRISLSDDFKILCEFEEAEVDKEKIIEVSTGMWTKTIRHMCEEHRAHPKFEEFITLPIWRG